MGSLCCCCLDQDESQVPLLSEHPRSRYETVQEIRGAPIGKKWYHGGILDEEAQYRLKRVAEDNGDFLVYDAPRRHGEYVLLVFYNGKCHRWKIGRRRDGSYFLGVDGAGVRSYQSVRELVKRHRGLRAKPLKFEHGGTVRLNNYAYVPENAGKAKYGGYDVEA